MKGKVLGIFGLLAVLCIVMTFATSTPWFDIRSSTFLQPGNIQNLLSRTALFGILGIGVAFVIITGGIDLSIGSLVCLSGVLLAMFLQVDYQAVDSSPVTGIHSSSATIEFHRPLNNLQPGDRIRYSGGRSISTTLFTVKEVAEENVVSVEESISNDENTGEVVRAFPLTAVERNPKGDTEAGAKVVIEGKHVLHPRDRVTFVHPKSGLKTEDVVSSELSGDSTTVYIRNDPGERLTADWLLIPLQRRQRLSVPMALASVLLTAGALGLIHGLLITRARLQPFVVTLCGLMIYRGVSRWLTNDNPAGLGEHADGLCQLGSGRLAVTDSFGIPYPFFFLLVIGLLAALFLNRTIWGRYLLALGRNEEAARFSGINTSRVTLSAYVICAVLASVGGMLFALDSLSVSPASFGNFFELYAIAASVLGGCSLRGGEGSVAGVIIGTAMMQVLNNLIVLLGIPGTLEFAIIGSVILVGVLADEGVKRLAAQRKRR